MKKTTSLAEINEHINSGSPVLLYFSGQRCSVCKVLKPKIEEAVTREFPKFTILEIEAESALAITGHFTIFSVPVMLVFFDGKEFYRKSGNMSVPLFIEELRRPYELMFG